MPRMGFESTTPVFERTKLVHALDRAATLIGIETYLCDKSRHNKAKAIPVTGREGP
jgi:hypothetical protein